MWMHYIIMFIITIDSRQLAYQSFRSVLDLRTSPILEHVHRSAVLWFPCVLWSTHDKCSKIVQLAYFRTLSTRILLIISVVTITSFSSSVLNLFTSPISEHFQHASVYYSCPTALLPASVLSPLCVSRVSMHLMVNA